MRSLGSRSSGDTLAESLVTAALDRQADDNATLLTLEVFRDGGVAIASQPDDPLGDPARR